MTNSKAKNAELALNKTAGGRARATFGQGRLVYIRPVAAGEVMDDLGPHFENAPFDIDENAIIYSVCDSEGQCLALVGDRDVAFAAARQFEMTPVSVH